MLNTLQVFLCRAMHLRRPTVECIKFFRYNTNFLIYNKYTAELCIRQYTASSPQNSVSSTGLLKYDVPFAHPLPRDLLFEHLSCSLGYIKRSFPTELVYAVK